MKRRAGITLAVICYGSTFSTETMTKNLKKKVSTKPKGFLYSNIAKRVVGPKLQLSRQTRRAVQIPSLERTFLRL